LSAGHNFYSPWYNRVVSFKYECGIGSKAAQEPLTSGNTSNFLTVIPDNYRWRNFSLDVAAIKLCDPPAKTMSSFRLATIEEIETVSSGSKIYTAGYPAAGGFTGSILTHIKTKIRKIEGNVLHYEFEPTHKGMSGSPVWVLKGDERVIIGVHVKNGGAYLLDPASIKNIENLERDNCK
jgi:V8-like Glu-specific endopeptidase